MSDTSQVFTAGDAGLVSNEQRRPSGAFTKRLFDIVIASMMLIFFLPLFVLVAAIILCVDGRGVFFAHERVGRGGRTFKCLKFRSMVRDADAALAEILENSEEARAEWKAHRKLKNDPRIMPVVGKALRASSLDELPQIFNVLRGDMSLVGPRPVVEEELTFYGAARGRYLSVRPGLTGPWQIGNRSDETYENRVKQDVDYIENWSIGRDIRIVFATARMFLKGRAPGAY